jgi:hypothetical protein
VPARILTPVTGKKSELLLAGPLKWVAFQEKEKVSGIAWELECLGCQDKRI